MYFTESSLGEDLGFKSENIVKKEPNIVGASQPVKTVHAPNVVATPFPPLNFNIGEKACPNTPDKAIRDTKKPLDI